MNGFRMFEGPSFLLAPHITAILDASEGFPGQTGVGVTQIPPAAGDGSPSRIGKRLGGGMSFVGMTLWKVSDGSLIPVVEVPSW